MPIPIAILPSFQSEGGNPSAISADFTGDMSALNAQSGSATLVAGTVTISGVTVTAGSVVQLTRKVGGGTLGAGGLSVFSQTVGANLTGNFVVRAIDLTGALSNAETSTFGWILLG